MKQWTLVVDTNVVVAGLLSSAPRSPVCRVLDGMLAGHFPFLTSPDLISEYRRVLLRPSLVRLHGLSDSHIDDLVTELVANAIWREPSPSSISAPDAGDSHLWDLLACHPRSILVTGDKLLVQQPFAPGRVVTPEAGLQLFETS
ncbi:putative toxin-antitoxin system toxin component, PIN family [Thioalkalivibrio sp. ALE16]|uniref:PIN domain-containing protein n=1 Tax=Thioalkalivibrio sp. ALE16 TaxID=1158172 RepID=UPI00038195BB|nr:PIN domain-containing protein [Thioalkalivibrio sp. ALE16]